MYVAISCHVSDLSLSKTYEGEKHFSQCRWIWNGAISLHFSNSHAYIGLRRQAIDSVKDDVLAIPRGLFCCGRDDLHGVIGMRGGTQVERA